MKIFLMLEQKHLEEEKKKEVLKAKIISRIFSGEYNFPPHRVPCM